MLKYTSRPLRCTFNDIELTGNRLDRAVTAIGNHVLNHGAALVLEVDSTGTITSQLTTRPTATVGPVVKPAALWRALTKLANDENDASAAATERENAKSAAVAAIEAAGHASLEEAVAHILATMQTHKASKQ